MYKKCTIIFFILLVSFGTGNAQQDTVNIRGWIPSAVTGINISQLSLSNWSQGGENSLTWTIFTNGGLNFFSDTWRLRNYLKAAYGRTKLGGQDYRTNDNEFYLENVLSRKIGWAVDPYISNLLRTNIAAGFHYEVEPAVQISDFFDPGYLTQSIGFTYDRVPGMTTRLGFALQETFTNKFRQYSDDISTSEIESFKLETGLESVTTADYSFADNLLLKSVLRLFSRYESLDIWDIRWDNIIAAKINDYVDVKLSFLLVYEKSQSVKTQIKEALQLGFFYSIY